MINKFINDSYCLCSSEYLWVAWSISPLGESILITRTNTQIAILDSAVWIHGIPSRYTAEANNSYVAENCSRHDQSLSVGWADHCTSSDWRKMQSNRQEIGGLAIPQKTLMKAFNSGEQEATGNKGTWYLSWFQGSHRFTWSIFPSSQDMEPNFRSDWD